MPHRGCATLYDGKSLIMFYLMRMYEVAGTKRERGGQNGKADTLAQCYSFYGQPAGGKQAGDNRRCFCLGGTDRLY